MNSNNLEKIKEYLGLILDLRKIFLERYREEIRDLTQYATALMSVLGLIAGFGFTAFKYIFCLKLFLLGEVLVIFSIIYLILKTKDILANQPIDTENQINNSVSKAREIKKALIDNNESEIIKLGNEFNDSVFDISSNVPEMRTAKDISGDLSVAIWVALSGIILILSSFIL